MLTIKNTQTKDRIVVSKANIRTILKGTVLEYLGDENVLTPNTLTTFDEILTNAGIVPCTDCDTDQSDLQTDWDVFQNFLQCKSYFNESPFIQGNAGGFDTLATNIDPHILMDRVRTHILSDSTPTLISKLGLDRTYEQLVFYEYYYNSSHISLHSKLICILENDYTLVLNLIEDGMLDICTTSEEVYEDIEESKRYCAKIRHNYFHSFTKNNLFNRFVELHSNWFGFTVNDVDEVDDRSIRFSKYITNSPITTCNALEIAQDVRDMMVQTDGHRADRIHIKELCHLNQHYRNNPLRTNLLLEVLIPKLDFSSQLEDTDPYDEIRVFSSVDLLVRMMEDDNKLIDGLTSRQREKTMSLWMRMCSPSYKGFGYSYICSRSSDRSDMLTETLKDEKRQSEFKRSRQLILSKTIVHVLSNASFTFSELGYILSTDDTELFKIVCKNSEFKTIHPAFFNHMPPKILDLIISRSFKTNKLSVEMDEKLDSPQSMRINVFDLIERTPEQIIELFELFRKTFKTPIKYEFSSVCDMCHYVECLYIVTYWDYMTMLMTDPTSVANILVALSMLLYDPRVHKNGYVHIESNIQLDLVLLRSAFDNFMLNYETYLNVSDEGKRYVKHSETFRLIESHLTKLMNSLQNDEEVFRSGPDFNEIRDELVNFGVADVSMLNTLCDIYDAYEHDRHIEHYVNNIENENDDE